MCLTHETRPLASGSLLACQDTHTRCTRAITEGYHRAWLYFFFNFLSFLPSIFHSLSLSPLFLSSFLTRISFCVSGTVQGIRWTAKWIKGAGISRIWRQGAGQDLRSFRETEREGRWRWGPPEHSQSGGHREQAPPTEN